METKKKYTLEANTELRFENRHRICKTGSRKIDVEVSLHFFCYKNICNVLHIYAI